MKGRPTAAKHGATIGHRKERALSGDLANETYSALSCRPGRPAIAISATCAHSVRPWGAGIAHISGVHGRPTERVICDPLPPFLFGPRRDVSANNGQSTSCLIIT